MKIDPKSNFETDCTFDKENPLRRASAVAKISLPFPAGDISQEQSDVYDAVFAEQYLTIQQLFYAGNRQTLFDNLCEAQESEVIFKGKDVQRTGRSDLVLVYLKSFFFGDAMDGLTIDDVLRINNWKFTKDALLCIAPLLAITLYNLSIGRDFGWWKCKTVPSDSLANWSPDSFTETCGAILINLFIDDFPWRPAISNEEDDDTVCKGIANNISNSSYEDYRLITQLLIYVAFLLFSFELVWREKIEKQYLRVALHLNGVFLPMEDQSKVLTPWRLKNPKLVQFLPYFDRCFAFVLGIGYLLTITIYAPAQQEWYVFPTKADQEVFMDQYDDFTNWCNTLSAPVFVTYSQPPSDFDLTALAEVVLFFAAIYEISLSQSSIYDWIDPDSYMNHKKQAMCSYYSIHINRSRVFNELMVNDWRVIHIEGPLIKRILTEDDKTDCGSLRKMLGKDELDLLQKVSNAIEEHPSYHK